MIDIDTCPSVVAKYQRAQRRIGGSGGKLYDCPRLIVIHTMESGREANTAANNATWQRDVGGYGGEQVSSHFAVDATRAWRCVEDDAVAFTQATPWNDCALSIEQAGRAAQTVDEWHDGYGTPQLEIVAQICAAWSQRWGIPLRYVLADELARTWNFVSGVTTHYQITLASQTATMRKLGYKAGSHTDPGAQYPMDELLARALALCAPRSTTIGDDDVPEYFVTTNEPETVFVLGANGPRHVTGQEGAILEALHPGWADAAKAHPIAVAPDVYGWLLSR